MLAVCCATFHKTWVLELGFNLGSNFWAGAWIWWIPNLGSKQDPNQNFESGLKSGFDPGFESGFERGLDLGSNLSSGPGFQSESNGVRLGSRL